MLHIVGDYTHNIDNTIEARYQGYLLGTGRSLLRQLVLDFSGRGLEGDDVTLTIDSTLSKQAYKLLDGRRGAVVILNYQTGAILAAVSSPSTSPESVINYKNIPDSALFNRALLGSYAPGSTFKILTAAAWLNSQGYDAALRIDCDGKSTISESGADESGSGHGQVDLAEAFAESCNVMFGQIGVTIGPDQIQAVAAGFGIGEKFTADLLDVRTSQITVSADQTALSWLAIGQPSAETLLQITPLQLAMIAGAIGNDGAMMQPHIIDHLTDPTGAAYQAMEIRTLRTILDKETARQIETLMIGVTEHGTGGAAAVKNYTVAGKTGTVQVEGKKNNALYVGYIVEDECPYAIAVVIEEGGSGSKTAAPIAAKLLKAAIES